MSEPTPLEAIFFAALEKAPTERAAYLDEACAGHDNLRCRVQRMLDAQGEAASFLESPLSEIGVTSNTNIDPPVRERPGMQIGPYKLLQQIGEGGFGIVFMADQLEPVRRRVALKVIKPGMDTRQVIARFEAERQALAVMDHPNIAKVLDAGTVGDVPNAEFGMRNEEHLSAGRPYFVMELVRGIPITTYCDDNSLPVRERLALFVSVCQAIHHAHTKGIIHRDIKPTNVLVALYDGVPVPKVIDFGVAKATAQKLTEKTMFTGFGQLIGTLEYMAPEQAQFNQLDIDTRSDVYSLGVLLYELLTGMTPFDQARLRTVAFDETLRIIREEEPPKPSTRLSSAITLPKIAANRHIAPTQLRRQVTGDLDWIAMKCLEKDRNRRYDSASGLAQDIERFLHDEPVQAGPPSTTYRLRKYVQRHRGSLAVAAGMLLAVFLVAATIGLAERDRAARKLENEHARSARLATVEGQVRESLSMARTLIAENKLASAREKLAQAIAQLGNDGAALGNLAAEVEAGKAELDRFQQFLDLINRAYQAETAPLVEPAVVADTSDEADLPATAASPETKIVSRRPAAAVPLLLDALEQYDVLERDDWHSTLQGGILASQQTDQIRRASYEVLLWLADDMVRRQQGHESKQKLSREAAARKALVYLDKATSARLSTQALYAVRAGCHKALGEDAAAEADTELAAQISPTIAMDHFLRGQAAYDAKNMAEGVEAFEAALQLEPTHYWSLMKLGYCLGNLGQRPDDFAGAVRVFTGCILKWPDHAYAYFSRGLAYRDLGRHREALADCSKAIELDPRLVRAWYYRGLVHNALQERDKALADFNRAIELAPNNAYAWYIRGFFHNAQKERTEALADFDKSIELDPSDANVWYTRGQTHLKSYSKLSHVEQALADHTQATELDPNNARYWAGRGRSLRLLNQPEKSIPDFDRAIELDPLERLGWYGRGLSYNQMNRPDKALADFNKAIELNPQDAFAWTDRGVSYLALGQPRKALADFDHAITDLNIRAAYAWHNRGFTYDLLNQPDKALADFDYALELNPKYKLTLNRRGNVYKKLGQPDKAIADFAKAIELSPDDAYSANTLAWLLATWPDEKVRDPSRAVDAAEQAVRHAPTIGIFWNTLGVARYRAGDWQLAIAALDKAIELRQGGDASEQFFLAMCYWKRGQYDNASAAYQQAADWMEKNLEKLERTNKREAGEFRRFQAEAVELMQIGAVVGEQETDKK